MRRTITALATIAWGLTAVACGSGDTPSIEPTASSTATPLEGNQAPILREVRIQPDEPAARQLVRAIVSARDPEGDAAATRRARATERGSDPRAEPTHYARRIQHEGAALARSEPCS